MAYTFTAPLVPFQGDLESAPVNALFNELLADINTVAGASTLAFPADGSASQYLRTNGSAVLSFNHAISSDAAISLTGAASFANGDIVYFNGTNFVRIAAGTAGQKLQANGAGAPTWVTTSIPSAWEAKTGNFTTADGGRYQCSSGVSSIALLSPADVDTEFWIRPLIANSFVSNPVALTGAMNVAGAAAASYSLNENVIYHFVSNGTDYDVAAEGLDR